MNNKAFTIVEVLAVVIMISVLSAIVIPMISDYLEKSKEEHNLKLKEQMLVSGKNFYTENKDRLPSDKGAKTIDYVTVSELSSLKYLKGEFIDAYDNSCRDKSYVVAINDGAGLNYYVCMKCGNKSYITSEEKEYCDRINYLDETFDGTDDYTVKLPTCEVVDSETGVVDDGVNVTVSAGDKNGYIQSIYVVNEDNKIAEQLSDEEKESKSNQYEKTVVFKEYGTNAVYALDNNYNKVLCTKLFYDKPVETKITYDMYLVSKDEFEKHKDTGFTDSELESLTSYSGNEWTNKYVYVKLSYYKSQFKTIKVGDTDITGKKFLFISREGNVTTNVVGINVSGNNVFADITTKIDRTGPAKPTITNTSGGSWTNVAVTVGATSVDDASGTDHFEYNIGSGWVKDWTSTDVNTASKNWSKANRNYSMQIKAVDKLGNESEVQTTAVKIDINPPSMSTHCHYSGRKFRYYFSDTGGSGVYAYKWGYCYSKCPNCPSSYMCSSKSVDTRLNADSWHYATYKETNYAIAANSSAKTIQVTTKWIIRDLAGNTTTTENYTDTWYYGGSYSPSGSC